MMANGRETSARSRRLDFVKEDEDGGEMGEVTCRERISTHDHDPG